MAPLNSTAFIERLAESRHHVHLMDMAALFVFVGTIVGFIFSDIWDKHIVPKLFFREERALAAEVTRLSVEAEAYSGVDKLHLQSQLRRRSIAVKRRLNEVQARRHGLTLSLANIVLFRKPIALPITTPSPFEAAKADGQPPSPGSPNTSDRGHGTRSAIPTQDVTMQSPQSSWSFWLEVMHYTCPTVVFHMFRIAPLVMTLLVVGNPPALVGLPRDRISGVIGQCSPAFLFAHVMNVMMEGPSALRHTANLLHETDELAYLTTRQLLAQQPGVEADDVLKVLSLRAANPYASALCWYMLCVVFVRFAKRVMR